METLESLEKQAGKKADELAEIKDKIEALETKQELPALKKKYEGKYFKYRNTYGGSCKDWWLYHFVIEVSDSCYAKVISWEETTRQHIKIQKKDMCSLNILGEEITAEEYEQALNKFRIEILALLNKTRKQTAYPFCYHEGKYTTYEYEGVIYCCKCKLPIETDES